MNDYFKISKGAEGLIDYSGKQAIDYSEKQENQFSRPQSYEISGILKIVLISLLRSLFTLIFLI